MAPDAEDQFGRVALCPFCSASGHIGELAYNLDGAACPRCHHVWLRPRPVAVCEECHHLPATFVNRAHAWCVACLIREAPAREPDR